MANRHGPLPAKISPPRLVQTLPRERLFDWLDRQRARPGVWLTGRPGAGKTVLAAHYAQVRGLPGFWYRLDTDDNDVGTFFAMLGLAVSAVDGGARLPRFAAEHLTQPRVFARAWFRAAFAALPRPLVLVFDNLEQAALPVLPQLLAMAIDEAPAGVSLLVTCRHAPPPELAAAALAGTLAVLPPQALQFTPDEAASFADSLGLDPALARAAAQRVDGWAAGLRLLSHAPPSDGADLSTPVLFDYFAGLLHERLTAPVRHLLQVGALLPWMPADLLADLAAVADAEVQFEHLVAQNLFIERAGPGQYRQHPLLRDFLLERGRRDLAPAARAALLRRAARWFADHGEPDMAIDLLFDSGDAAAALDGVLDRVEDTLACGRLDRLDAWLSRLPESLLHAQPRAMYARARLGFLREDPAALQHYERACDAYAAQGDVAGQQLCAAGALEWIYNTDSFVGHQRWCELLTQAAPSQPAGTALETLRLLNGGLLSCFYRGDFHRDAASWVDRVLAVLQPGTATNEQLSVAVTLLGCLERDKRWDDAQLLADRMEALLAAPDVGPRLAILVRQQIAADLHRQTGDFAQARRLATQARAQAAELGFAVLEFEAVAILLLAAQYEGDDPETERLLEALRALMAPGNVYHQRFWHQMRAWHALQRGRLSTALEHAAALRAAIDRSDMPPRFRATWLLVAIYARFADGEHDAACQELARLGDEAEHGSGDTLRVNLWSLQAWRCWRDGEHAAAARWLGQAWQLAVGLRYYQLLAPLRALLSELAAWALAQGLCTAFAHELIRRRKLAPPSPAALHWPWPLRIVTLGRFEVLVDGQPLVFPGKTPRKPLALLKALIAFGGQAVPLHLLTDALWPDDDADAAHDACNVALHRLRRLLPRGAEVLTVRDGCLSLHPDLCTSDARAFERTAAAAAQPSPGPAELESLRQALALYGGHFLVDEPDARWSVSMRERLRGLFRRAVVSRGQALEASGHHEEALACYRHGLEIDDLDEQYHQGVMQCALKLKRPAEGLAAYQRLRRLLAVMLGASPSAASEALHQQLRVSQRSAVPEPPADTGPRTPPP